MCIFFGRKIKGRKIKNTFFGAENEKENEIRSASKIDTYPFVGAEVFEGRRHLNGHCSLVCFLETITDAD